MEGHSSAPSAPAVADAVGVYVHIPFCRAICPFCTYPTAPRSPEAEGAYLAALRREIGEAQPLGTRRRLKVDSIYFGGGTPSLLDPDQLGSVLEAVRLRFDVDAGSEVTVEVDPGTADLETLAGYREWGVNRLSIGAQSLNGDVLEAVGRQHGVDEIYRSFEDARRLGLDNLSLDLMVGLPGEDMAKDLAGLSDLAPQHASVYILDTSEKLPMGREIRLNPAQLPDEVRTLDSYLKARDALVATGLDRYEISSYARAGRQSRHNLKYWTDRPYLGFGAAAHSYFDGCRFWNVRSPARYVEQMASAGRAVEETEPFDPARRSAEYLFTGLRLTAGVRLETVESRYGVPVIDRFGDELRPFMDLGLVRLSEGVLSLTEQGFLVSNEIFQVFL